MAMEFWKLCSTIIETKKNFSTVTAGLSQNPIPFHFAVRLTQDAMLMLQHWITHHAHVCTMKASAAVCERIQTINMEFSKEFYIK